MVLIACGIYRFAGGGGEFAAARPGAAERAF